MTHISHNVAQACKDALPSAVGDDRCDGLSGRIHKCVCLYGRKSTGTIHHIQKKNILTGINQVRVIMAVYWVQGCATYICTAKPKAPPPPSHCQWTLEMITMIEWDKSCSANCLLKLWSTTPTGRWQRPPLAASTSAGHRFPPPHITPFT